MNWIWGLVGWVAGLALIIICSPQRDAILWWLLPGPVHQVLREVTGIELVKSITEARRRSPGASWRVVGATYYWRTVK